MAKPIKHFETLWNESEKLTQKVSLSKESIEEAHKKLIYACKLLVENQFEHRSDEAIGYILFLVSYFSNQYNVNVYEALMRCMQEQTVDMMEQSE